MKNYNKTRVSRLTLTAMTAAVYAAATLLLQPLAFGPLQLRAAEAMTLLPIIMPEAVAGVTLGCALSNAVGAATGANICGVLDIFFGTAATFTAAIAARKLGKTRIKNLPLLSALMPVILNGAVIGGELAVVLELPFWLCALQVAGSEALTVFLLGVPLVRIIEDRFGTVK